MKYTLTMIKKIVDFFMHLYGSFTVVTLKDTVESRYLFHVKSNLPGAKFFQTIKSLSSTFKCMDLHETGHVRYYHPHLKQIRDLSDINHHHVCPIFYRSSPHLNSGHKFSLFDTRYCFSPFFNQ